MSSLKIGTLGSLFSGVRDCNTKALTAGTLGFGRIGPSRSIQAASIWPSSLCCGCAWRVAMLSFSRGLARLAQLPVLPRWSQVLQLAAPVLILALCLQLPPVALASDEYVMMMIHIPIYTCIKYT